MDRRGKPAAGSEKGSLNSLVHLWRRIQGRGDRLECEGTSKSAPAPNVRNKQMRWTYGPCLVDGIHHYTVASCAVEKAVLALLVKLLEAWICAIELCRLCSRRTSGARQLFTFDGVLRLSSPDRNDSLFKRARLEEQIRQAKLREALQRETFLDALCGLDPCAVGRIALSLKQVVDAA